MALIHLNVEGHDITCTDESKAVLSQGSHNIDTVSFTYDSTYQGYTLYATMYQHMGYPVIVELESDSCTIPVDALLYPGKVYIGLRAVNSAGTVVATSGLVWFEVRPGAIDGSEGTPSTGMMELIRRMIAENGGGSGVPTEVRQAIQTLFAYAVYEHPDLRAPYDIVVSWATEITGISLNRTTLNINGMETQTLIATTTPAGGVVTWSSSDETVATVAGGVVTPTGVNGSCVITATCGGKSASCNVTVSGFATLESISAVYSGGTVYTTDTLDSLKNNLTVTAHWSDSRTTTVTGYILSGTIAEGTQTITVAYSGKTTTFSVTVAVNGWLYRFDNSLLSSGTKDFGFSGTEGYGTGHDGTGQCYEYVSGGSMSPILATGFTAPDLSGDFTISLWHKCAEAMKAQLVSPFKTTTDNTTINLSGSASNIKSGYTITKATSVKKSTAGIRFFYYQGKLTIRLVSADLTQGTAFDVTFPSSFDSTIWHHFAFTRKNGVFRFFLDGETIFTFSTTISMLFADQLSVCGFFATAGSSVATSSYGASADDFFVAEYCKWDSDFDPSAIVY